MGLRYTVYAVTQLHHKIECVYVHGMLFLVVILVLVATSIVTYVFEGHDKLVSNAVGQWLGKLKVHDVFS